MIAGIATFGTACPRADRPWGEEKTVGTLKTKETLKTEGTQRWLEIAL